MFRTAVLSYFPPTCLRAGESVSSMGARPSQAFSGLLELRSEAGELILHQVSATCDSYSFGTAVKRDSVSGGLVKAWEQNLHSGEGRCAVLYFENHQHTKD